MVQFENGDRVTTRTGPGLGDQAITGRVIGEHDMSSGPNGPKFYIVLLDEKLEGFPWSAIVLHGSMLDRLNVLDEVVKGTKPCPLCGGDDE